MTDYTKASAKGTLTIRDTGTTVEFLVQAGYSNFNYHLKFEYVVNGVKTTTTIAYPNGMPVIKVGSGVVTTSQTVQFNLLTATGTQSMGGPTAFSVYIDRGGVPSAPSAPTFTNITNSSLTVSFRDGAANGFPIDSRQIGYGTNAAAPQTYLAYAGPLNITGLTSGIVYYFWARTHNSRGWSALSPRASSTTLRAPDAPTTPVITSFGQNICGAKFSPNGNGGALITEYQIGYSTSSNAPTNFLTVTDTWVAVQPLTPGTTNYIWVRARNSYGYGPWSGRASVKTIAGARILIGPTWKDAVPFIRVNGVWKLARPYVRVNGVWKITQ
jgi:hypothetical protein